MTKNSATIGTLGPVSAPLIRHLQNEGATVFSVQTAAQILGKNIYKTSNLLSRLVKKSILARIKGGVYIILQVGGEETQLSNWPIIAKILAGDTPYFLSHYSAMRLHGMTTHALTDVYITSTKRHRHKKINRLNYHFIYRKKLDFWGQQSQWVTQQDKVMVSDLERTLLDGLERPDLCGGIIEVCRSLWTKQKALHLDRLFNYARKYPTLASVKRLGFLLETLKINEGHCDKLQEIISEPKGYVSLDPQSPAQGRHLSKWQLQVNINIEELTAGLWG